MAQSGNLDRDLASHAKSPARLTAELFGVRTTGEIRMILFRFLVIGTKVIINYLKGSTDLFCGTFCY